MKIGTGNRPFGYSSKDPESSIIFMHFSTMTFDRVALELELLSLLWTFENSIKCSKISFDCNSFQNS